MPNRIAGVDQAERYSGDLAFLGDDLRVLVERLNTALTSIHTTGVWAPVIGGQSGTAGQTYDRQEGYFHKLDTLVIAHFNVLLSAKGTIAGNVVLAGLPFAAKTTVAQKVPLAAIGFAGLATNWIHLVARPLSGSFMAGIEGTQAAGALNLSTLSTTDIGNATQLVGTVIYSTD